MLTWQDIERFELSDSRICTVLIKSHREALDRIETLKSAISTIGKERDGIIQALTAERDVLKREVGAFRESVQINHTIRLLGLSSTATWAQLFDRIKALVELETKVQTDMARNCRDGRSVYEQKVAGWESRCEAADLRKLSEIISERDATLEELRAKMQGDARLLKILSATYPFLVSKIKKLDAAMKEGA